MTTKHTPGAPNYLIFKYFSRKAIFLGALFCLCFSGYAQKGQNDIILHTCIQVLDNGLIRAEFGYTNPTNKVITVDIDQSVVFLSDKDDDDESRGIKKILGITNFLPGTHDKVFGVVFNNNGHAKWTVTIKNKDTKIRATSSSAVCVEPCVVCPVYGGAGKSFTSIGAELTALATGNAGEEPSDIIYQFNPEDPTEVLIEIVPKAGRMPFVLDLLKDPAPNGFARIYNSDPLLSDFIVDPAIIEDKYATIDVYFPIGRLLELNDYPDDLNFSRSLYTPLRQAGVANTKGDNAMLTNIVRESFVLRDIDGNPLPIDGTGISVAVISDSFDKQPFTSDGEQPPQQVSQATRNINQGDLSPVQVLKDYPFGEASDEGRAMLQIVHDVAPGAQLGFSTGVLSPRDMALAIDNLALEGYDIINDDITYPMEPFYDDFTTDTDDGSIAKAIKRFTDSGGLYVTSAGNFANTGYQSVFVNSEATPVLIPALEPGTIAHVFGGDQDVTQEIEVDPGTYFLVLQWDEDQASQNNSMGAATDLDIYVVSETGQVLVNTNRANDFGDAVEAVVFQSIAENARANIMITSANGNAPAGLAFRYIIYRSDGLQVLEYNTGAPTVTGHAMTPEAITVGAVDYRLVLKEETIIPEFFSSFAGNLLNGTTIEVDIAAPDGGNTTVLSVGNDIVDNTEGDPDDELLPNFFGTSAAAPHVAGAAALLLSTALPPPDADTYSPSWYPDGLPYEVLELFQNNAIAVSDIPGSPMGSSLAQAGMYGLINAVAAFKQIAVQTAVLEDFTVVTEGEVNPGVDTYDVTITGNYIPADAEVFLGDEPLAIVGEPSDTEITATVGPFVGNPELTVFTNSGDLPGGGRSNGLSILPDGKIALKVTANNVTVEFGDTPLFTYTVEGLPKIDGLPDYDEVVFGLEDGETLNTAIEDINAALTNLGQQVLPLLPEIVLAAEDAVGPFPDVDFYGISAGFGSVNLTAEQLAAYQIYFINLPDFEEAGRLTITKKDLIVQPQDISIVYGEVVNVILNYFGINETGEQVPLDTELDAFLKTAHSGDFYEENTLILINKLRAVINEQQILNVLENGSWMASGKMFETNKLRAVINGELNFIDLEVENFDNYIASVEEGPVNNKLRAVINKLRAVINGEDLLNNQINLEDPETNKLRAVINGTALLNQNDFEAYESIFAVVDWDDGNETDENGDPIDPDNPNFNEVYATNLLSSLDVTPEGDPSKVYPGAILSNFGANFNKQYLSANLNVSPATLSVQTPDLEIDYGVAISREEINSLIEDCDCPGLVIGGYVYDENETVVFPDGIPYYFVDDSGQYELGDELGVGSYEIRIRAPQNYTIGYESIGTLKVLKKKLAAESGDLVIDEGSTIDINDIVTTITGYVYNETQSDVFPDGIQYSIEDKDGNPYSPGATGVYFIKILEPINYMIEYLRIGTVYINPVSDLRKIRTYTDCVELNPDDPDGLNYIAHFRYINPNDRSIYILPDGPENQLTGSGAPTAVGDLPINFLPGEHTFEIRFDGNPIKWEVISMDSNHKTSTTTEVNANSNKCNSNNSNNGSVIPTYILHPNPTNGILYIDQNVPAIVTIDIYDFFGILHLNTVRDGTNAPITHTIDMSGSNYPVGVYFISLAANGDVQVFSVIKAE